MAATEEILVKMGMDISEIKAAMVKAQDAVGEFSQSAGKGLLHAESGARAMHRLLHDITQSSPLLGTALRLAISPVAGAVIATTVAFTYFKKKLDDFNESL